MPPKRNPTKSGPAQKTPARSAAGLGEIAYNGLLEGIRRGDFRPGEPIREQHVTEWLKISRTPVRDAMRRLEAEGYLVHERHRGAVVANLDDQAVTELYALREVLEGAAAAMAARHASDFEVRQLEQLIDESARKKDPEVLIEYQRRITDLIHQAARNRYLIKTMRKLRETLFLLGSVVTVMPNRPATLLREHREILAAIKKRDSRRAEKAMRNHVRSALQSRLQMRASPAATDYPYVPFPRNNGRA
jgi:DNA-binding GntR family transcriptional regulator